MGDDFTTFLESNKGTYYLVSPPGNCGDFLLRKGLEYHFKKNNIRTTSLMEDADSILIHGGGNVDDVWNSGIDLLNKIRIECPGKQLIVAPSTCHFSKTNFEKFLNNFNQEVHFFARERNTFQRLKDMNFNSNIHIYLAHDTAFLLENSEFLSDLKKKSKEEHVLCSFRTDRESKLIPSILGDMDPSHESIKWKRKMKESFFHSRTKKFVKKHMDIKDERVLIKDASYESFDDFLALIRNASSIYTDRLHVAILGSLLEKKTFLFKTKYDKVDGVFDHSLKNSSVTLKF